MSDARVLVIGGGAAGLRAALHLAACGIATVLAEKEALLGGRVAGFSSLFPAEADGGALMRRLIAEAAASPRLTLLTETEALALARTDGAFAAVLQRQGTEARQERFDAVLLAAGYELFPAERYGEYGYGRYERVITGLDFERQLSDWTAGQPRAAAFLQCVGARDRSKGMPYCSRVCCMYTAKQAVELRRRLPDCQVYVFYMDVRAHVAGGEEFVRRAMETERVRYIRGRVSKVFPRGGRLLLRAEDTLMGLPLELEADLVVLAAAMVARPNVACLARQVGAETDAYGFLHPPLSAAGAPPTRIADGVFAAGACGFPADAGEAMTQGAAAAADICAYLRRRGGRETP